MSHFYMRVILIPIAIFTAILIVIRTLPYDDHELRALLLPEGCPAPCLMGIRPGITAMDEAVAILQANSWVGYIEKESNRFSDTIKWTWSNRIPKWIIPTSHGEVQSAQNSERPFVDAITISNFLQLGEVYGVLGPPEAEKIDLAGYSTGEKYAYIDYIAFYKKENLSLFHEQNCLTGYMTTGNGETAGLPFTMPVDILMGSRFTLPVSGELIPTRSPIHLRPTCGS